MPLLAGAAVAGADIGGIRGGRAAKSTRREGTVDRDRLRQWRPECHFTCMTHDAAQQTRDLIQQLRAQGHHAQADHLAHQLATDVGRGLLLALREACETILTAIEAIDPATETMIEELRLEVEKRLGPPVDRGSAA